MSIREGVLLSNYIVDATDNGAGNDKWTSTTVQSYTVPTGRRWALYGGQVKRDTATGTATLDVTVYDSNDKPLLQLATAADATTLVAYPVAANVGNYMFPVIMAAGWYVKITIGEAQGAAAYATCHIAEVR